MMRPQRRSRIPENTAFVTLYVPVRFTARFSAQSSSRMSFSWATV
jgi:hypothetical protein